MDKISNNFQSIILFFLIIFVTNSQVSRSSEFEVLSKEKEEHEIIERLGNFICKNNNSEETINILKNWNHLASQEIDWPALLDDNTLEKGYPMDLAINLGHRKMVEGFLDNGWGPSGPESVLNFLRKGDQDKKSDILEIINLLFNKDKIKKSDFTDEDHNRLLSIVFNQCKVPLDESYGESYEDKLGAKLRKLFKIIPEEDDVFLREKVIERVAKTPNFKRKTNFLAEMRENKKSAEEEKKDKIGEKKKELGNLICENNESNLKEIDQFLQDYKNLASQEIDWGTLLGSDLAKIKGSAVDLAILYRNEKTIELLLQYGVKPLYPEAMLIKCIEKNYGDSKELKILAFLLKKGLKIDLNYKDDNQGFLTSVITNKDIAKEDKTKIINSLLSTMPDSPEKLERIQEAIISACRDIETLNIQDGGSSMLIVILNTLNKEKFRLDRKLKIIKTIKVTTFVGLTATIIYFLWKNYFQPLRVSF